MADELANLCGELQALQRQRAVILKSRNMQANRLQAVVAGTLGYASNMGEADRKKKFAEAAALIKSVVKGEAETPFARVIRTTWAGIDAFNRHKKELEAEMVRIAGRLPVAAWVESPELRGFGLLTLAIVVGECGDLRNYPNPAKVWRRMGCAPWSFDEKTLMGATWRSGKEGKLPAGEWESFGYSPRRRSIAYLIGEGIVKQNTLETGSGDGDGSHETEPRNAVAGPFKLRYLEARATFAAKHPDYKPLRCHLHGMLCATKRLLRDLWINWNKPGGGEWRGETDAARAPARPSTADAAANVTVSPTECLPPRPRRKSPARRRAKVVS